MKILASQLQKKSINPVPMNIAIIDDELHCVESLVLEITQFFPEFKVVYKGTRPMQAIEALKKIKIDLLFLDVEMPEINGFELLNQFDPIPFDIIFTTAYSQYAIAAFKTQAVNYLLKPIDERELNNAINSWLNKLSSRHSSEEIEALLNDLKKEGILTNKIAVPITDGLEFLEVDKIMYCQSQSNYVFIYMENGRQILISKTLKEVEKVLRKYFFFRPNQSFLVNPNYMQKYSRSDGGYLVMTNDIQIPVSNSKKDLINNIFNAVEKNTFRQ